MSSARARAAEQFGSRALRLAGWRTANCWGRRILVWERGRRAAGQRWPQPGLQKLSAVALAGSDRPAAPPPRCPAYGSAKTYSIPPFFVTEGRSLVALMKPSAALESRIS